MPRPRDRRRWPAWVALALLAGQSACTQDAQTSASNATSPAARVAAAEAAYPPWQHGRNAGMQTQGLDFTVAPVDVLADFHGNPQQAALVLYVGGNYFFAMAPLVEAFAAQYRNTGGRCTTRRSRLASWRSRCSRAGRSGSTT